MSGTSADAIDVALVTIDNQSIRLIDFIDYPNEHQIDLCKLNSDAQISLKQLAKLHAHLANNFADAALAMLTKHGLEPEEITAIGSHGQTIFHAPELGMSLQIGHPAIIAKKTGIITAADFRVDDMALGGQGAPFAPAFHQAILNPKTPTLVINIGGIANVSYLQPKQPPLGFDSGPGNALMDELCQRNFNQAYDLAGQLAQQTPPDTSWLADLLSDPYFSQPSPKSTGREYFNQAWLSRYPTSRSALTQLSTLNQLTVESLASAIETLNSPAQTPCYICGGGAYNTTLLKRLQVRLHTHPIKTTEHLGINPDAIEAMMCAWLACNRITNLPTPLKSITGAGKNTVLGGLWHP